ncbi:MAG: four helix bundle protein [Ruminococcaceae bacterium]|nr:four helix bundle protein [Oscillospiraceae bacterium]
MAVQSYKDLIVWQKSMKLVTDVYSLTKQLPKEEIYALSTQMRRAVISIPSNIAEGQKRKSPKEFCNFLSIARGSLGELETQLLICVQLNYLSEQQINNATNLCEEISKMLNALIEKISEKES